MPDYSSCFQHPPLRCLCCDQSLGHFLPLPAARGRVSAASPALQCKGAGTKQRFWEYQLPKVLCAPRAHTSSPPLQPISPDFYINLRVSYALTVKALKESIYLLPLSACQDQSSTWQSLTVHSTAQFLSTHWTPALHMHKYSHAQLEMSINLCWSLSKTLRVLLNLCKIYLRTEENPRSTNRG